MCALFYVAYGIYLLVLQQLFFVPNPVASGLDLGIGSIPLELTGRQSHT